MGSLSFLQGIFPTQELNWGLLHCRWILYHLSLILLFSPQLSSFPSLPTFSSSKYGGGLLQPLQPQSGPGLCQDPQGTFPQPWDPLQDLVGVVTSLPQPGVRPHRHRVTPRKDSRATAQGLYEWRVRGLQAQGGESRAEQTTSHYGLHMGASMVKPPRWVMLPMGDTPRWVMPPDG